MGRTAVFLLGVEIQVVSDVSMIHVRHGGRGAGRTIVTKSGHLHRLAVQLLCAPSPISGRDPLNSMMGKLCECASSWGCGLSNAPARVIVDETSSGT
eukprot:5195769-Pyramimonas_sp.AAC.1